MVRQIALVPAGCQPWNLDVVASQGNRFAYSSTLAIYIYEHNKENNDYRLVCIMSEHKKTVTSICWCPDSPNLLASSSLDGNVIVFDISTQTSVSMINLKEPIMSLSWCYNGKYCLGIMGKRGPLWLWYFKEGNNLSLVKETQTFSSVTMMFRWHHEKLNRIAFGHEDGSVSILDIGGKAMKHIFKSETDPEEEVSSDAVIALDWDPLSNDYLLICNQSQGVRLVDIPNQQPIMCFQLPSTASVVQTMSWIRNAPGMFVTGDRRSGILRVWTVSNMTPIENIKIKNVGFHQLEVIESSRNDNWAATDQKQNGRSKRASMYTKNKFSLPHVQIVCTFLDGGVGLYKLGHKKWAFLRDQGHIETIFDCKFKPDDKDHLATASFDGTIKIWDITSMTCIQSSPGNEGIIYHISWAPADLNCIAACTSKQGAFIWDIKKGKVIKRLNHHVVKTSVYCIAWNHLEPKLLMTCGADGYCIIQQVSGSVIQRYKHPAPVFGCQWSPFNKDMLATGCEDKMLRVFFLSSSSDQPIKQFSGHEAKVFHIRWNPLREGVSCSGSDDGSVRVWDYTRDQCTCTLKGHKGAVRGLTWNSEIPSILASGSWDFTIRIWDTRDGACLHCIHDHGADVYGLTSHPSRPFLLASSSRDSTVRLWSITSLCQQVELNVLSGKPCETFTAPGTIEPSNSQTSDLVLSGAVSKDLINSLQMKGGSTSATLEEFSKFFSHPCGTTNLWDLVSVTMGKDTLLLSSSYSKGIVHRKHITQFKGSEALQLEMIKLSKFGAGIGAPSQEDRLKEAAGIHLRIGNLQKYCELLTELGQWERALAVAPSVSMAYWHQLNDRYCSTLLQENGDDLVPFCIAAGDADSVTKYYKSRGLLTDAAVVAQSASEGNICRPSIRKSKSSKRDDNGEEHERLVLEIMENMSTFHFARGSPTLAACCHLAVDDHRHAVSKLIRGNELELAMSVGQVLGGAMKETDLVIELLSRRCENIGRWELGLDLLNLLSQPTVEKARLCARCSSSMAEINALHMKAGLPPMELCADKAKELEAGSNAMDCVQYHLLSSYPELGLKRGLQFIKDQIEKPEWTTDMVFPMLQLLGCVKTEKLQHSKNVKLMYELLVLSAYIGALIAIKRQYTPIVDALFSHAIDLLQKEDVNLKLSASFIEQEKNLWTESLTGKLRDEKQDDFTKLIFRCGTDKNWPLEPGPDCVASSHLPSHSDVHVSVITKSRIKGQAFFLENGTSAISLNEALMWAKVNPFSPLGSGVRINPY